MRKFLVGAAIFGLILIILIIFFFPKYTGNGVNEICSCIGFAFSYDLNELLIVDQASGDFLESHRSYCFGVPYSCRSLKIDVENFTCWRDGVEFYLRNLGNTFIMDVEDPIQITVNDRFHFSVNLSECLADGELPRKPGSKGHFLLEFPKPYAVSINIYPHTLWKGFCFETNNKNESIEILSRGVPTCVRVFRDIPE